MEVPATSLSQTAEQSTALANTAPTTRRSSTSLLRRESLSVFELPIQSHGLYSDTTYRLRIINPGTFVPLAFSVDGHTLTVIEGDGTPVEPVEVSSVSVAVAQRYSVLLRTNQTAGAYWMRAALDTTQFTVRPECLLRLVDYSADLHLHG